MSETAEVLFARYGPRYRMYVTAVALLGMMGAVITTTTVNVAVPDIMGSFGIGHDRAQWLSTGALAGVTVGMLLNAWLIDSFGQRKTFVGSLCIFAAALVLAGLSPNDSVLIAARVIQGLTAGVLQTLAMSTMFSVFPPERRGTAMGLFSITVILGPAIGPTLGGLLIEQLNWRYVFYMALPFSIAGILFGSLFMPERGPAEKRAAFDWLGFALLCIGVSSILIGMANGQREGWNSAFVLGLLFAGLVASSAFIAWELTVAKPLVDLRVLRNLQFASAACVGAVFGFGTFGTIYLIPLFVQSIQGFTAFDAGLLLMPGSLLLAVVMPFGGYLSDHFPARWLIVTGLMLFAASAFWMGGIDANTSFWGMAMAAAVTRIAQGLINPALNVSALRALPPVQLLQGAGMINFSRQLGAAFGVNLLSVVLDRRTSFHSEAFVGTQTAANAATSQLLRDIERLLAQAGAPPGLQAQGALHYLGRVMHEQAYTIAFRDTFLIVTVVFLLALLPAWAMRGRPRA